ncbi:MAG TPA: hypothetical protein VFH95_05640 [Candidatus Kapabacteria bacterium]|nr:hypothetical protein [Candidatus Kapabacteria bacterium]
MECGSIAHDASLATLDLRDGEGAIRHASKAHEFLSIMESEIQNGMGRSSKSSGIGHFIVQEHIGNRFVIREGIRVTLS